MDKLFTLYRYLARNKHRTDDENPYNVALERLENVLTLLTELDSWGKYLEEHGGIVWEQADQISERIIQSHRTALCEINQSAMQAILDFTENCINMDQYHKLVELLTAQGEARYKAYKASEESLGDLDEEPF